MSVSKDQRCLLASKSRRMCAAMTLALMLSIAFSQSVNSQTLVVSEIDATPVGLNDEEKKQQTVGQTVGQMLEPLSASVVQVRNRERLCCLGTLAADGLVVTKRSELSGVLTCVTADGTRIAATMIASDPVDDLALLRLLHRATDSEKFLPAIELAEAPSVEAGDVLFSVGLESDSVGVGVATVAPRRIPVAQPVCQDCVDLGVTVSVRPEQELVETMTFANERTEMRRIAGARVKRVYPRTVGERVGMLQGDLLVSINQRWVPDASTLRSIGSRLRVGQKLGVVVVRDGALKQLGMTIDHFSRRVYHDRWGGGPFSERRFGFSTTIVHDTLLEPNQCGGPLVDLDGNVVGLNIARSMRVATFAVPVDRVGEFVNRFRHVQLGVSN